MANEKQNPIDLFLVRMTAPRASAAAVLPTLSGTNSASAETTESRPAEVVTSQPAYEISRLTEALSQQAKALTDNTAALGQSSQGLESLGKNLLSMTGLSIPGISSKGSSFLGLSPLVSLVGKLFQRDSTPEVTTLPKFELPTPLQFTESLGTSPAYQPTAVSYGDNGLPRAVSASTATSPQITFNVQAMDARSFLDHSGEIASALKSALLHSHAVSDVMSEMS